MRSLEGDYQGKINVKVIQGADAQAAQIKRFGIGNHGLVGLAADGAVKLKMPGHKVGLSKDEAKIKQLIEAELNSKLLN